MTTKHIGIDLESTNAIKEDWGGKPFVDMIRRWKYALEKYPEVCGDISIGLLSSLIYGFRLILIELWLRARVGEGMLSSQSLPLSLSLTHTHTILCTLIRVTFSWIQGNPEFGFGCKALVCHDGVFDATYNGFSTDELFFVRCRWRDLSPVVLLLISCGFFY